MLFSRLCKKLSFFVFLCAPIALVTGPAYSSQEIPPLPVQKNPIPPLPVQKDPIPPLPVQKSQAGKPTRGKEAVQTGFQSKKSKQKKKGSVSPMPPLPERKPRYWPQSYGTYNDGRLVYPSYFKADHPNYRLVLPKRDSAWANKLLVEEVTRAADEMKRRYPDVARLMIADVTAYEGGYLSGHKSHQIGLDADIGFYRRTPEGRQINYFRRLANSFRLDTDFDLEENWEFWQILFQNGKVARVFVDRMIKYEYCKMMLDGRLKKTKENRNILKRLQPSPGHKNHMHVRLFCPKASPECRNQPDWFYDHKKCKHLVPTIDTEKKHIKGREQRLTNAAKIALLQEVLKNLKFDLNQLSFGQDKFELTNFVFERYSVEVSMRAGQYVCRAKVNFVKEKQKSIEPLLRSGKWCEAGGVNATAVQNYL